MFKPYIVFKCATPIESTVHLLAPREYVLAYREMVEVGGYRSEERFYEILGRFYNKTGLKLLPLGGFTRYV